MSLIYHAVSLPPFNNRFTCFSLYCGLLSYQPEQSPHQVGIDSALVAVFRTCPAVCDNAVMYQNIDDDDDDDDGNGDGDGDDNDNDASAIAIAIPSATSSSSSSHYVTFSHFRIC